MKEHILRRAFLGLFFVSGFSALLYQVLWFRVLGLILGATVLATVTVLTAFMTGLALGASLASRLVSRLRQPLRTYAILECVVAVTAVLSPYILEGVRALFVAMSPDPAQSSTVGTGLLRCVLAFLVLIVPTTAMGATLPILSARFVHQWEKAGVRVGALYAANIWGGVAGVLLGGFLFLPVLGVRTGLLVGGTLTLAAALGAYLLSRRVESRETAPVSAAPTGPARPGRSRAVQRAILLFFLFTGFCSFVYEVLWTRLLVLHIGSSAYAFSIMLALFLLGLALGGGLGGWAADRFRSPLALLGIVEVGVGATALLSFLYLPHLSAAMARSAGWISPEGLKFGTLVLTLGLSTAPLMLPTTVLIGASFPIGVKAVLSDPRLTGSVVGRLYSWNTLGNILGALTGGLLLLPALGAQTALVLIAGANGLAGALLVAALSDARVRTRAAVGLAAAVAIALLTPLALRSPGLLSAGYFSGESAPELLHLEETPQGTVTVTRYTEQSGVWKSLEVDGVNVAGTSPGLVAIQKLQGHLPLLLHPSPRSVLHIGFGSGGTARAVSTHSEVQEIHIAEINPAILRTSAQWFAEVNQGVLDDPRVRVVIEDGRNYLLATRHEYDVILSDAVHPRYAGNSALYTSDYFELARERLAPGGILSLWLPIYGVSTDSFRMILKSMRAVFPDTTLWYVNSTINEFCIVIGRTGGEELDADLMLRKMAEPEVRRDLLPIRAADPVHVLDYLVAQGPDLDPLGATVPLSRDDRPLVEFLSARSLDRDGSWIQVFDLILKVRRPRTDLVVGELADDRLREDLRGLYDSTTANLQGQLLYLLSGHVRVAGEQRKVYGRQAEQMFQKADRLAPDEKEPWERFGLPTAYPAQWND